VGRVVALSIDGREDARQVQNPPIERARQEDAAALRRLYVENADRVHRFLARMGVPPADLDDLLQDVFVVVHRKLPEFDGRVAFTTWLFAIAVRIAKNHRRWRFRHRVARLVGWEPGRSEAFDPVRAMDRKDAARELEWILERMKPKQRAVFVLYELESHDGPAIARIVGAPVHTVWSRLRLAREEFKKLLRRREGGAK